MIVRVKPLGRFHIGLKQVGGFDEIGADAVWAAPLPSTVLGALAQIALSTTPSDADPFTALGCKRFWGPLVEIEGRLHFQAGRYLYGVEKIGAYIKAAKEGGRPPEPSYEVREELKPGVRLSGAKTVENLYYAEFVWIGRLNGGAVEPGRVAYVYYADCGALSARRGLARLGGEGRLAELAVEQEGGAGPKECAEGVLLSPLLFYAEGPYAEVGVAEGLTELEEVYGIVEGEGAKVRSTYVGLGYSMALGRRRALYQALLPGTAVRLKGPAASAGLFKERGYGSLYCAP